MESRVPGFRSSAAGVPERMQSFCRRHERIVILLALLVLFVAGHSLLNELAARRAVFYLPSLVEDHIPLLPSFVVVYLLGFVMVFVPAVVVPDGPAFRRTARAFLVVILVSFAIFLAFPITVRRAEVPEDGGALAALLYGFQSRVKPHNTFPSLHVALCSLAAIACLACDRRLGILVTILAGLVAASTLFLKLHMMPDVVAGVVLAGVSWLWFGRNRTRC